MVKKITYLFVLVLTFSINLFSQDIPEKPNPPRLVNDFVGIFTPEENATLERKLVAIDDSTSTQIAVVVVADLLGYDAHTFSYKIADKWEVGQKGKDNGIVILIKPKNGNERGQVYIQVGYGLEGVIPDALAKRIVELEMIPEFRQNNAFAATDKAINAIVLASKGMYKAEPKKNKKSSNTGGAILIIILIIIIISFFNRKNRSNHKNIGRSDLPFWLLLMGMSGKSSGGGWGNFSSGSGSFGGFGGGNFGGGGAGGSW